MLVLITYDIQTSDTAGRRRLAKVARLCVNFGQRVQASVFECSLDPTQLKLLQRDILNVIDTNTDSVRFYNLGKNYKNRIEHFGAKPSYMPDDVLMV